MATPKGWYAKALTGGGANALDFIDGDSLTDLDVARVLVGNIKYEYILDADSGLTESSPDRIVPDTNPGTKVWILQIPGGTGLPRSYLAGCLLSNDTDTAHDINITAGEARDSADGADLALSSETTKQIDAVFAAGDDAGGMFTGAVGNSTWYHVFLIKKDSDGTIDAGFDTSITAANIPAGYTEYRRVGSVLTDGSANILNFIQVGDIFRWKTAILDISLANMIIAKTSYAISVPLGLKVFAWGNFSNTGNTRVQISSPDDSDGAPSETVSPLAIITTAGTTKWMSLTNVSSQISLQPHATTAGYLTTEGYIDIRGKD